MKTVIATDAGARPVDDHPFQVETQSAFGRAEEKQPAVGVVGNVRGIKL